VSRVFGDFSSDISRKKKICSARVSSDHQKEGLERQVEILDRLYPGTEIIKDIGSGLNFKKKRFIFLLDRVYFGEVEKTIVLYKDRLRRFGFELWEFICNLAACRIMVHNEANSNEQNVTQELSKDLLFIVSFCCQKQWTPSWSEQKKTTRIRKKPGKSRNQQGNATRLGFTPINLKG
jgi:predicted site-specific integrase-resolvase